jgi:malonyl CoA-acyl carrier protein transacylase
VSAFREAQLVPGQGGPGGPVTLSPCHPVTLSSSDWETELFVLRAKDRAGLRRRLDVLAGYLGRCPDVCLKDLAFSVNGGLEPGGSRVAVVAGSAEELRARLGRAAERLADPSCAQVNDAAGIYYFERPLHPQGRLAFLFPGEGAQYLNMLADLCPYFPEVRAAFERADELAAAQGRAPLGEVLFLPEGASEGEQARAEANLRRLDNAMFGVLIADWAVNDLLRELGLVPDALAGHSMGELAALFAAGCLEESPTRLGRVLDALDELQRQEDEGEGEPAVLLAVAAGRGVVGEALRDRPGAYLAMDNCPHQSVVVGPPGVMSAVEADLKGRRVVCERLPFRRPYHTPLFEPHLRVLDRMFEDTTFRPPQVPVYSCTTAAPFPPDPAEVRRLAVAHWASPVEFTRLVERMYADGVRLFVEAGPRGNLSAFVADALRGRPCAALPANLPRRSGVTQLNHLAAQLAAHHVPLRLGHLYARREPRRVDWEGAPPAAHAPHSAGRAAVVSAYLGVMDQFLDLQREVTEAFLNGRRTAAPPRDGAGASAAVPSVATGGPPVAGRDDGRGALHGQRPLLGDVVRHEPGREVVVRRELDLREDLFGADHTLAGRGASRVDPDQNGLPVMPMTFSLEMMAEAADLLVPGKVPVEVRDIRLTRWLPFDEDDPITVEVAVRLPDGGRPAGARVELAAEVRDLGNSSNRPAGEGPPPVAAKATLVLADSYPEPPPAGEFRLTNERPCSVSLEALYWNLFHGPRFHGVCATGRVGDEGIESPVRVLPRAKLFRSTAEPDLLLDPVLLDVVMHPLAAWHLEQLDQAGRILLPVAVSSIQLFGPPLPVGTALLSRGRVDDSSRRHFTHTVDGVGADGRLWCRLAATRYWRFFVPFGEVNFNGPKDEYFISRPWKGRRPGERIPGGDRRTDEASPFADLPFPCCLIRLEPPADLLQPVMRLATARVTLSADEWRTFRRLKDPDKALTRWLFARIAAKDAVRLLWHRAHGERMFPADIELDEAPAETFRPHRRASPGPEEFPAAAVAHAEGLAVGLAAFGRPVGVAVERLAPGDEESAARVRCARRAVAQALGLDPERDAEGLLVRDADAGSGIVRVADPKAPSDVVLARTDREGDVLVAACFGERSPA